MYPGVSGVFVHTYNVTSLEKNKRNKEPISKINVNEIYEMTNNVIMDTDEEFLIKRNISFYRQYFPYSKESWEYPQSMDNMIKQWHSIESVWDFMDKAQQTYYSSRTSTTITTTSQSHYKRIGLFRIDLEYMNPINIFSSLPSQRNNDDNIAVLPDFGLSFPEHELNDRLFYGSYKTSHIWSHRFNHISNYFNTTIGKSIGGLHSETMIHVIMSSLNVWKAPICARRIRLTGHIEGDCWCKQSTNSSRELPCVWWSKLLKEMNSNKK